MITQKNLLFNQNNNLEELLVKLTLLFPLTTLLERYFGFANKLLLFFTFGLLIIINIKKSKIMPHRLLLVLFFVATFFVSLTITPLEAIKTNPNMSVYYIFMILYYLYVIDNKHLFFQKLVKNRGFVLNVVKLYSLILTITIFLPWSYITMDAGGWGDTLYFASFSNSPNRVGPASVYILVLMLFLLRQKYHDKWLPCLLIPNAYVAFSGGSRTYFVLIACMIIVFLYYWLNPKKMFWILLIPAIAILTFVTFRSSMMTKIQISLSSVSSGDTHEMWRRLTNSRSVIWPNRLNAFKQFTSFNKLFGKGVNFSTYTFGLWSHSDFIEILCSYGYIGLTNYLIVMFSMFKCFIRRQTPFFINFLVVFIWFFNAFFNFFYCYFNALMCYPVLLLILYEKDKISIRTSGMRNRRLFYAK